MGNRIGITEMLGAMRCLGIKDVWILVVRATYNVAVVLFKVATYTRGSIT